MDATGLALHFHEVMSTNMWAVYLCLLVAPFVQEDAAIIAAATLSLADMAPVHFIFLAAMTGLIASDSWKFWVGRLAHRYPWARRLAARPGLEAARATITERLGAAMMTARFVPGARIALYVAAGYFGTAWGRFSFWLVSSAVVYVSIIFALFLALGSVIGEQAQVFLPLVAGVVIALALIAVVLRRRSQTADLP